MNEIVSRDEQRRRDLLRSQPVSYVPNNDKQVTLPTAVHQTTFDLPLTAQGSVVVHTDAVDRAVGHGVAMAPIALSTAVLAVLIALVFGAELFTLATFLVFWGVGTVVYSLLWMFNLLISTEGIMFMEVHRKWDEVRDSRRERWAYYAAANGLPQVHLARDYTLVWIVVALCSTVLVLGMGILYLFVL